MQRMSAFTDKKTNASVRPHQVPDKQVSVDLFGPMPSSKHVVVVQDLASRFPAAKIVTSKLTMLSQHWQIFTKTLEIPKTKCQTTDLHLIQRPCLCLHRNKISISRKHHHVILSLTQWKRLWSHWERQWRQQPHIQRWSTVSTTTELPINTASSHWRCLCRGALQGWPTQHLSSCFNQRKNYRKRSCQRQCY